MAKSNKKSDLKHKGISHKQQGEVAKERGLSDSRMLPLGRLTRGIGSSYAHAVAGSIKLTLTRIVPNRLTHLSSLSMKVSYLLCNFISSNSF